jgi:hypothetical protein
MSQDPSSRSPYDAPSPGTARTDNPKAIWSLILGIVSLPVTCLIGFGLVVGIPAVVLGWQAKDQPTGRGLAIAGMVTGGLAIVIGALWLVLLASGTVDVPDRT